MENRVIEDHLVQPDLLVVQDQLVQWDSLGSQDLLVAPDPPGPRDHLEYLGMLDLQEEAVAVVNLGT